MSRGLAKLITVAFLVIVSIVLSQKRHGIIPTSSSSGSLTGLLGKRLDLPSFAIECAPLSYPVDQQCDHVREACPETDTFLTLPHLQAYFCASSPSRPVIFIGLLIWLAFLFSTLGIGASDFFCPNLATIATVLGLDENVAGVTFLAVGNGSPDVFSTFSAMKAQSGSLAIGELLGAASFIVSVVVGSMCIIKPFHVNRRPFLRDVGFFTVAVAVVLWILHDGEIHKWEALLLVSLYVFYVAFVVVGIWWEKRYEEKRRRESVIQEAFVDDNPPHYYEPYRDDVPQASSSSLSLAAPPTGRGRTFSNPMPPRTVPQPAIRSQSRSPRSQSPLGSPSSPPPMHNLPSFSLLSALEFRDVVASFQHQATSGSLAVFEPPISSLGMLSHRPISSRIRLTSPSQSTSRTGEINPWDATFSRQMPLGLLPGGSPPERTSSDNARSPIPGISVHPPSSRTSSVDEGLHVPMSRRQRVFHRFKQTFHVLFPHLHGFPNKSVPNILVAIFATPGVLAFTVTLPVVTTTYDNSSQRGLTSPNEVLEGRLIDFEEDGVERVLVAEDDLKETYESPFSKWLTAVQCTLGPLVCVLIIFGKDRGTMWYLIGAAIAGVSTSILVLIFADRGNDPAARLARCFMGFVVAVVWIMAIADEVVSVLKTFGLIFGLSDAIIGLTIFAVGNSLADLVANTSVAAFAPIMGFSACFGGPMLNILIGIGVSGSIMIGETGQNYVMHFSTTLLVSSVGLLLLLLATLVFVPWNGYLLSRRWGIFLLASYVIMMVANVIVEVKKL